MSSPRLLVLALLAAASACGDPAGPPTGGGRPDLGVNASLHGARPFPDDNPWNTPVDGDPVDPNSDALIAGIGADTPLHPDFGADLGGEPFGIPYVVVGGNTPGVPVAFDYADESDPGPYPIPPDPPIEGGAGASGDRHILVIDRDAWRLYELFAASPDPGTGGWHAGSGAVFDLRSNALRPAGWTSADAAGLPIFPGLVRYDEVVEGGEIRHAPIHGQPDPAGLSRPGPSLRLERSRSVTPPDGDAGAAPGRFRRLRIRAGGQGDPPSAAALRDDLGGQRR